MRFRLPPLTPRRKGDLWCVLLIVGVVTVQWALAVGIFSGQRLLDPISYGGDAFFTAASVTAGMRGEYLPFVSKQLPSLGAPFVASWNDFPVGEDWLYFVVGTFARLVGVFGAINITFWLACNLAALSMFAVARRFHLSRPSSTMAAILFGVTAFIISRGTHHFSLIFYWVVPWQMLAASWLASRRGIPFKSAKFKITLAVGLITGWSFIYYVFFAAQLFGLALLVRMGRPKRRQPLLVGLALALVTALATLSMFTDTIMWARQNGVNQAAVYRNPRDVELYALKPVAMLVPGNNHRWPFMRRLAASASEQSLISAEIPAPYLGIVQVLMLFGLVASGAFAIAQRKLNLSVTWLFTVAWLIIGHGVGGENSFMGLFGLRLFRSVNRVSIVILAYVLLFAAWALPRALRRLNVTSVKAQWAVGLALAVFGTFEPPPVIATPESIVSNHRTAESDRALVAAAEAQLPAGAMVFELPVMDFPEVPPFANVDSYEMFRPYFYAKHLRFSHGEVKHRPNGAWKFRIGQLAPPQMVQELKANGFSSLYLNLKGFPGQEQRVIDAFTNAGARVIAKADLGDSVFMAL